MPFDSAPTRDPIDPQRLALLRTAYTYLVASRGRWCQNAYAYGGARCAVGAIRRITREKLISDVMYEYEAVNDLAATIRRHNLLPDEAIFYNAGHLVTAYNDRPTTQYGDILTLFEQTITRLDPFTPIPSRSVLARLRLRYFA